MFIVRVFQVESSALSYLSQRGVALGPQSIPALTGCFWNLWPLREVVFTSHTLAAEGCVVLSEGSRYL